MEGGSYLVTGANRGLGLALVRELVSRGRAVIGTARRPDRARELAGTGARVETLDVADDDSARQLGRRLAGVPIDVLVHNAAIGRAGPAADRLNPTEVLENLHVNAAGPVRVTQALMSNLRAGRRRTIVGITSGLGSLGRNTEGGWVAYRMGKAALNMYVRSLAAELRREGFVCVVMCPGWVKTDMGGRDAPLDPEEAARAVIDRIERLSGKDNGRFMDRRGRDVPW